MLRPWLAIWKKELRGYFLTPASYLIMVFFLAMMGYSLWVFANMLVQEGGRLEPGTLLFGENLLFWLSLIVVIPILTMRLLADEYRSGTFETLMTAPVTPAMLITAKYTAAFVFYLILWLPTLFQVAVLKVFDTQVALDIRVLLSGYGGALLVGAFALALGLLCSSCTRSPIVAAMATFAALSVWFVLAFVPYLAPADGLQRLGESVSVIRHMLDFSVGIIDTRALVLYLSGIVFLLFTSTRLLESRI